MSLKSQLQTTLMNALGQSGIEGQDFYLLYADIRRIRDRGEPVEFDSNVDWTLEGYSCNVSASDFSIMVALQIIEESCQAGLKSECGNADCVLDCCSVCDSPSCECIAIAPYDVEFGEGQGCDCECDDDACKGQCCLDCVKECAVCVRDIEVYHTAECRQLDKGQYRTCQLPFVCPVPQTTPRLAWGN